MQSFYIGPPFPQQQDEDDFFGQVKGGQHSRCIKKQLWSLRPKKQGEQEYCLHDCCALRQYSMKRRHLTVAIQGQDYLQKIEPCQYYQEDELLPDKVKMKDQHACKSCQDS